MSTVEKVQPGTVFRLKGRKGLYIKCSNTIEVRTSSTILSGTILNYQTDEGKKQPKCFAVRLETGGVEIFQVNMEVETPNVEAVERIHYGKT